MGLLHKEVLRGPNRTEGVYDKSFQIPYFKI